LGALFRGGKGSMKNSISETPLLEVKRLQKYFHAKQNNGARGGEILKAVDDISFTLRAGEALGLVGESGCGKSTTARAVLRLVEPDAGDVFYKGIDMLKLCPEEMRFLRKEMQIIFQDPLAALNPKRRIRDILSEPFIIHGVTDMDFRQKSIAGLLQKTGLSEDQLARFPHEFSGGQLQRIGIARALALNPRLIVADEPVSALDVSIQAQIVNLLSDLKENEGIAFLFISHDMGVVEHFCDRVAVMYLGKIVEMATAQSLYAKPRHPYTLALMAAVPSLRDEVQVQKVITGEAMDTTVFAKGCAFQARCPIKEKQCEDISPTLKEIAPGHSVACHLSE